MKDGVSCLQRDSLSRGLCSPTSYVRSNHINADLLNRLGLETCLEGHDGCVNCLEWNENGTLLASGSDDCNVILWDPFSHKSVLTIRTGHRGNIFSVKFLPNLNDNLIVTAAADTQIRVHDISSMETRHHFTCHFGRVKRLVNIHCEPFLFWSASEDGTVRQFDLRDPNQAGKENLRNVLVNLNTSIGPNAEAKCLDINPLRPEMLAVGGNDAYIRVYDRRKLVLFACNELSSLESQNRAAAMVPRDAARYFVAGCLPNKRNSYRRSVTVTCVSFSPNGDELLGNMGGDHVYMFELNKYRMPYCCAAARASGMESEGHNGLLMRTTSNYEPHRSSWNKRFRSDLDLEQASAHAAWLVKAKAFVAAVRAYNQAVSQWPFNPQLYNGRATALIKRGWIGDTYSALLDLQTSLGLTAVSNHSTVDCVRLTASLLSIRCLIRLKWINEARTMLKRTINEFAHLIQPKQMDTTVNTDLSRGDTDRGANDLQLVSSESLDGMPRDLDKILCLLESEIQLLEKKFAAVKNAGRTNNEGQNQRAESWFPLFSGRTSSRQQTRADMVDCSCVPCAANRLRHVRKNTSEKAWRVQASDYSKRFVGHCNSITDIKEANFFGGNGQYVIAGSDCGSFFVWDRDTTNIARIMTADSSTVNCVQPHPSMCLLASSGIDSVVRLWAPKPDDDESVSKFVVEDHVGTAERNQRRSMVDPLEIMLDSMNYRITGLNARLHRRRRMRSDSNSLLEQDQTTTANNSGSRNVDSNDGCLLQPQIASTVFDQDSTNSSMDSDSSENGVTETNAASTSHNETSSSSALSPLIALRSLLGGRDHVFLYRAASSSSPTSSGQQAEPDSSATEVDVQNTEEPEEEQEAQDEGVMLEVPCTTS